jgi:hypothetical protein
MTVAELITLLSRYPPEATVIFHDEEIAIDLDDKTLDQINENGGLYEN